MLIDLQQPCLRPLTQFVAPMTVGDKIDLHIGISNFPSSGKFARIVGPHWISWKCNLCSSVTHEHRTLWRDMRTMSSPYWFGSGVFAASYWTTMGRLWFGRGAHPLKWLITAVITWWLVGGSPSLVASKTRHLTIDCLMALQASVWITSMLVQKGKNPSHMITPWGGEECWVKLSKIVILCYYVSIPYPINYCRNIQKIKNCQALPTPPTRGGVWCDTPAVNLEPITHQMAWLERGQ